MVEAFPYNLSRAAAYLRLLADGGTHQGRSILPVCSFNAPTDDTSLVSWTAPPNLIEPPQSAAMVAVKPLASKKGFKKRGAAALRGRLSAHIEIHTPPVGAMHGVLAAPEVGPLGDLLGIENGGSTG